MYIASEPIQGGRRASVSTPVITSSPTEIASASFNMNQVDRFEEKKVSDLKRIFLEFTKINLIFHSKSIEMFTRCFRDILDIDEKADITEFRYTFKIFTEDKVMSSSLLAPKKNPTITRLEDDEEDRKHSGKQVDRSSDDEERRIL